MKILVIEDNPKHLADAKKFFEQIENVEVVFAEDHESAVGDLGHELPSKLKEYDGVISDIYFPLVKGSNTYGQEEPIGVSIMLYCKELGIPCVLNTAGNHHGSRYQWICSLQRSLRLPEITDASGDHFKDAEVKNWEGAFNKLSKLL